MFNNLSRRTFTKQNKSTNIISELFTNRFPIKLNKKDIIMQDQNLESFIPYDKIVNQVKLVSLSKEFLDNLINHKLSDIYEEKLLDKILYSNEKISDFNRLNDNGLKINYQYNLDLRKVQFLVNLYNINNIALIGVDPDRRKQYNLKTINYYRDMVIHNTVSNQQIRADIVVNREKHNILLDNKDAYLYLITQFEYSLITKKKDSFKLIVEIEDEFNESKDVLEYSLNSINFKLETILNKVSLKDFAKNKDNKEDASLKAVRLIESLYGEGKNNFELKFIDIDNIMNGNELVQ
jgi:hypothetical protein